MTKLDKYKVEPCFWEVRNSNINSVNSVVGTMVGNTDDVKDFTFYIRCLLCKHYTCESYDDFIEHLNGENHSLSTRDVITIPTRWVVRLAKDVDYIVGYLTAAKGSAISLCELCDDYGMSYKTAECAYLNLVDHINTEHHDVGS